jgi:hypothetical protein
MKSPIQCFYLQNKAFFFPPHPDDDPQAEPRPLSTPCWCLRTHESVAPDGGDVTIEACTQGTERHCYKPELDLDA